MMEYRGQKYSCCQLISAINARIFLGGSDVADDEFEELAELVCCKNGAAIGISKAYAILGLSYKNGPTEPYNLDWIKNNLPVAVSHYCPKNGHHSVLIVNVVNDKLSLVNSFWEEINWQDFLKTITPPHVRTCRSFHLTPAKE